MRSKRSWGSSMMSSGSWVSTSSGAGPVMSWVTSVTSWSRDCDASPPRSRDESREGSRSRVVMGSGGGSRDEKSGGSELGRNINPRNEPSTLRPRPMRIRSLRMNNKSNMSSERPHSPTPAEANRLRRRPTPQIIVYSDDTLFQSRDPTTRPAWTVTTRPSETPFRPPIRGIFTQHFTSRSPSLQGATLVTPSPVESLTSLLVPSGSTRPVRQQHLLPGLPTSIAVVSSSPEASVASGSTAQGLVSAPVEHSSPIPTISNPILGLIDHFHRLSFEERRTVCQQLSTFPTEPPTMDHIAQPEVFPEEFLSIDPA